MKETWIYFIQPPFAPLPYNPERRLGFKSWLAGGKVFHSNDLFFYQWTIIAAFFERTKGVNHFIR